MTDLYEDTDPMIGPENKPNDKIEIELKKVDKDKVLGAPLRVSLPLKMHHLRNAQRVHLCQIKN